MNTTNDPDPLSDTGPSRRVRQWWPILPVMLAASGIAWLLLADRTPTSLPPNHPAVVHYMTGDPARLREDNFGEADLIATTDPQEAVDAWNRLGSGNEHRLGAQDLPDDMTFVVLRVPYRAAGGAVTSVVQRGNGSVAIRAVRGITTCKMYLHLAPHQYFLLALPDAPTDVERCYVEFDDFRYC